MFGLSAKASIPLCLFLGLGCIAAAIACRWKINRESVRQGMGSSPVGWIEQAPFPGRTLVLIGLAAAIIGAFFFFWSATKYIGIRTTEMKAEKEAGGQITPKAK
jgi:hypothetical protein